jgi:hypothetical protein
MPLRGDVHHERKHCVGPVGDVDRLQVAHVAGRRHVGHLARNRLFAVERAKHVALPAGVVAAEALGACADHFFTRQTRELARGRVYIRDREGVVSEQPETHRERSAV